MNSPTRSSTLASANSPASWDSRLELAALLEQKSQRQKRNRLAGYRPYAKQRLFHAAGATHRERLFMAGNQLGKTLAGGAEWAIHLTGRYPDWWEGKHFAKPVRLWAAGVTGESTRGQGNGGRPVAGAATCDLSGLAGKGVPDADARAAALNPEILKTLAGRYFDTKRQFGVLGRDQYGRPTYGFADLQGRTVKPVPNAAMPRVSSPAEARSLPSGTAFIDPNGQMRIVP